MRIYGSRDEISVSIRYPELFKISVFLVFALNALFQWFLVGLVPKKFYGVLAVADAPYAEGLKAVGLVGFPIILLCIGIAFGGDLSTINPGIAAPARYIYTMAEDGALPSFLSKIHPKFKTPYVAIIGVGLINFILIATGSINYIASVSLISLAICYMIGCLSYIGLRKSYPDMKRPYKAPLGVLGCLVTIVIYCFMLLFADKVALLTAGIITIVCIVFYYVYTHNKGHQMLSIEEEIGDIEEPDVLTKEKMDREYNIWKIITIIVTIVALGIYIIPMLF